MLRPSRTFAGLGLAALGALIVAPWGCSSSDSPPGLGGQTTDGSIGTENDSAGGHDSTTSGGDASGTDGASSDGPIADAPADSGGPQDAGDTGPAGGCHDGVKDGNETDVDCGGGSCPPCTTGLDCLVPSDCMSESCSTAVPDAGTQLTCLAATCSDRIKNGTETDVDCGGGSCPACLVGKQCGAPTDCVSAICNNGTCNCPPAMVVVPTSLTLGGSYCIDALEVTKSAYNTFNTANPHLNLPTQCGSSPDYTPHGDWPPTLIQSNYNGGEPVHYVDWCDAYAFCLYNDKHLCGAISGGAQDPTMGSVFETDAWYNACSAKGNNDWPYGMPYESAFCNGADLAPDGGMGSIIPDVDYNNNLIESQCQGGESGLYYMSGNVAEWENACDTNTTPNCLVRGGSYASSAANMQCVSQQTVPFDTYDPTIGFRCCD